MTASEGRSWAAEIRSQDGRSRSYVYLGQHATRGAAATTFDRWMRALCIDPDRVVRVGWSLDPYTGEWELSQADELALEFGTAAA